LAGALLDGKYRVDRVVAEGGFGVVYAGHHTVLNVPIAIKVLKPSGGDAAPRSERFAREAQTIAKLKHPSIVQVLDAGLWQSGEGPALTWMVLEWLTGQTLKANLVGRRGLGGRNPTEAMALLRSVLDAVGYAHTQHIVHRDLKPGNIMLSPGPSGTVVRVLDFGVAKVTDDEPVPDTGHTRTRGSSHAFSRSYAAPEQLSGGRTGPWTDIHALGLLLTELLTDRPPYPSLDPTELYQLVFQEDRPSPARSGVDVGPWQTIIERAVSLKPSRRYADAGAFAAALEESLLEASFAFSSNQTERSATIETPELRALLTETTRSAETASNTFSFSSNGAVSARRPARARFGSRRALSRVGAVGGLATIAVYLVLSGHRSVGATSDAPDATATATQAIEPPPSPSAEKTPPSGNAAFVDIGGVTPSPDPPSVNVSAPPQTPAKPRAGRRPATTEVETPVPSARSTLPPYVVE
jgi:serine/threonine-protein kinase